ncbi:metal-dependent hydrolase family protein [Sphingopyxis macrogoltabida]|uniref:Amidohydrolase n=1 Tax=Sphingopyxis macrogoltabida TaxID=33050 RepID=A0AAC9FG84_SPHMC|nr:amidohydrolase family protein [Sphingopyxis macrogoltabida]ALJ15023.1 amidohydrolase [Sphingopyxis macrogoltabida]AMU91271.1 amidohydrolase [Sphingopyxis macrogoltabida]
MTITILENARLFDGTNADCPTGMSVAIESGTIKEVSDRPITAATARRIDVGGRTLMPGLIDLHIHAYISDVNIQRVDAMGPAHRTAHAVRMLGHALDCGFTTVRDIGGGDWSLWRSIEEGLIRAPRFLYAGRIVSMTGGHGDMRPMSNDGHGHDRSFCQCGQVNSLTVIADGVDACIAAVREEYRRGAHTIKIMGSGGVASPTDPIWMNQYREDEVRAIVNECVERRSYASAHCHPTSAIRRCVEFGVRCIEHGTLIDNETAAFVAERGAFIVPTMAIIFALRELGPAMGFPPENQAKLDEVFDEALSGMDRMRQAGVKIGFGTDLLGDTYTRQCTEFSIRSEVFSPIEILRQATSIGAEVLQMQGKLGCVAAGAHADLIVVDGDPLSDIGLLARNGEALPLIMRAGEIVKNRLD